MKFYTPNVDGVLRGERNNYEKIACHFGFSFYYVSLVFCAFGDHLLFCDKIFNSSLIFSVCGFNLSECWSINNVSIAYSPVNVVSLTV